MGGALLAGWRLAGVQFSQTLIIDPVPGAHARVAEGQGATLNPPLSALFGAQTVVLAVKPQGWRAAAAPLAAGLPDDAVIVSILAGVDLVALGEVFGARPIARVMPTTAVEIARGVASIHAPDPRAAERAHALFDPLATTVDLGEERMMDGATAISGSGPAYLYAFVEALAAAGAAVGLSPDDADGLARATIISAAALLADRAEAPATLRRQVTSPGGTTEAALDVLLRAEGGLNPLVRAAVQAAAARAKALGT